MLPTRRSAGVRRLAKLTLPSPSLLEHSPQAGAMGLPKIGGLESEGGALGVASFPKAHKKKTRCFPSKNAVPLASPAPQASAPKRGSVVATYLLRMAPMATLLHRQPCPQPLYASLGYALGIAKALVRPAKRRLCLGTSELHWTVSAILHGERGGGLGSTFPGLPRSNWRATMC